MSYLSHETGGSLFKKRKKFVFVKLIYYLCSRYGEASVEAERNMNGPVA